MIVSLLQRILSQLKELAGNIGGAIKNILYDTFMTEEQLLAKLVENPDTDMNGFFYNSDIGEYCSFSGLYMSKIVSGEEVHYGYCEIRGVHDSEYLVDYRIDREDSTNWYKVDMVTHNDLISYTKLGIVGDAYDSTKTYNAGDYCIYHNVNYKKLGASEYGVTPTDDGVHWKAININNEISELNSNLKWKLVGHSTGTENQGTVSIDPYKYEELLIIMRLVSQSWKYQIIIPTTDIINETDAYATYTTGNYYSQSSAVASTMQVYVTKTSISIGNCTTSSSIRQNVEMWIYAR